jgi:hypothetical protein
VHVRIQPHGAGESVTQPARVGRQLGPVAEFGGVTLGPLLRGAAGHAPIPGSYLALSHSFLDGPPADVIADLQETYKHASAQAAVPRSRESIARFFDGFELVDPGLVHLTEWHSDDLERTRTSGRWLLAGVGRKP